MLKYSPADKRIRDINRCNEVAVFRKDILPSTSPGDTERLQVEFLRSPKPASHVAGDFST
jgi:hypothetical protein